MKTVQDLIDAIAPKHNRTSCSDEDSSGNEYFNEFGYPRCPRCALLYWEKHGEFPYGVSADIESIKFSGHPRITKSIF